MTVKENQAPAIQFRNVSVRYRVPHERVSGIKEYTIRLLQRRLAYTDFWAVRDVSFDVQPGEVFGIVGRNGAGKSTMLKVMARVLYPTEGRVVMRGMVAPLLELGGGFHPELTGRENVYMNMALLGHSRKETDELFGEIIDFAELKDFIESPIRTYSTGMVARLGFAVATSVRPEILLVDEVLSVGDTAFQEKCLARMFAFQERGTTITIVSHSMATVEAFCERALWLDNGKVRSIGSVSEVIDDYLHMDRDDHHAASRSPAIRHIPGVEIASQADAQREYTPLGETGAIYPAAELFDPQGGTCTVWLRFKANHPGRLCAIFHTDDSRYVLFSVPQNVPLQKKRVQKIVARAGGNRRVLDKRAGSFNFPELSTEFDISDPTVVGQWHMVAVTWKGYPEGRLHLYVNGDQVGEKTYGVKNDDGRPLPEYLAVGMRPSTWKGEYRRADDGAMVESNPESTMSIAEGGIDIHDMRLYRRALSPGEIESIRDTGFE